MFTAYVVIPVYRPDEKLIKIIDRLHRQKMKPGKIILINTGRKYYEDFLVKRILQNSIVMSVSHILLRMNLIMVPQGTWGSKCHRLTL